MSARKSLWAYLKAKGEIIRETPYSRTYFVLADDQVPEIEAVRKNREVQVESIAQSSGEIVYHVTIKEPWLYGWDNI